MGPEAAVVATPVPEPVMVVGWLLVVSLTDKEGGATLAIRTCCREQFLEHFQRLRAQALQVFVDEDGSRAKRYAFIGWR